MTKKSLKSTLTFLALSWGLRLFQSDTLCDLSSDPTWVNRPAALSTIPSDSALTTRGGKQRYPAIQYSLPGEESRDTQRFSTHYQGRFSNPNPVCSPGMVPSSRPGVQPPLKNGFSKSTQVHRFAPPLDTGRMLRGIDPYVARSILKRHPYFDDHTHNNKEHTL